AGTREKERETWLCCSLISLSAGEQQPAIIYLLKSLLSPQTQTAQRLWEKLKPDLSMTQQNTHEHTHKERERCTTKHKQTHTHTHTDTHSQIHKEGTRKQGK